jgi:hypothetical protein
MRHILPAIDLEWQVPNVGKNKDNKVRFGETPKPAREPRALPRNSRG